ncbi:antirestriction protein ArdA [Hyphomonas sp.]|uniref:antirestriction protein ArdA n=1 Tax=Hyphomonas sp. TaxID=87 RepID=UPI00261E99C8|nr:antirestriction protein ArdA [Hyphomonas sp.]MDF1807766.1 antirestriction protein ArdA [Hyphomonas sp.]
MPNTYHATPYDISATGFYFENLEEYRSKAATHRNAYGDLVEEFDIQFIDGDNYHLFRSLGVNQATLALWFDQFEDLTDDQAVAAIYLAEYVGVATEEIIDQIDDVMLFEGSLLEYAEDYVESTGLLNEAPESLRFYFDMESFARDLRYAGDVTEFDLGERQWIVQL